MSVPPLDVSVEVDLVLTGKSYIRLLIVICTAAENAGLGVAALLLAVIVNGIDVGDDDIVHLLHGVLDLKLVGLTVYDKAITVQLFALSRQLLCYDWLNDNSHLRELLAHVPLCENILDTVDEHQGIGVHDGVGVDLVNGDDIDLRQIAG